VGVSGERTSQQRKSSAISQPAALNRDREEATNARDEICITVTDTGFGIEDPDLPKLFSLFSLRKSEVGWDWACRFVSGLSRITAVRSR
jgi:hypothetical protein